MLYVFVLIFSNQALQLNYYNSNRTWTASLAWMYISTLLSAETAFSQPRARNPKEESVTGRCVGKRIKEMHLYNDSPDHISRTLPFLLADGVLAFKIREVPSIWLMDSQSEHFLLSKTQDENQKTLMPFLNKTFPISTWHHITRYSSFISDNQVNLLLAWMF